MANIRMYPPSRVIVSNPFIMETSKKASDELVAGVSFFITVSSPK